MQVYEDGRLSVVRIGPLGSFGNNAYVIADVEAGEAVLVDMPEEAERVLEAASGLRVAAVVLTHTHPDHVAGYDVVKAATGAPVLCHPDERLAAEMIDGHIGDGQELAAGAMRVRVLHTPGHTPGGVCLLAGRFLLSGDTLFPGGPGRTGTPDALRQIIGSITSKLFVLPDDTLVLPGHGEGTTIRESKAEYAAFASRPHRPDLCGDVLWADAG